MKIDILSYNQKIQIKNNTIITLSSNKISFKISKLTKSFFENEEIMSICGFEPLIYGVSVNQKSTNTYISFDIIIKNEN